jgi:alkaline phosphatase
LIAVFVCRTFIFFNICEMKRMCLLFIIFYGSRLLAQPIQYTTSNAHSHNDYEQAEPFEAAYRQGFGSIEADIFLVPGSDLLWVAHSNSQLKARKRSLDSLYLQPIANRIAANHGSVYAAPSRKLQLMIDIKTEAVPTLRSLIETLNRFPTLITCSSLSIVISGSRPSPDSFINYPAFIKFDALPEVNYSAVALTKIAMVSAPLQQFTKWNGGDRLSPTDSLALVAQISRVHSLGKTIRFWAAPDMPSAWLTLERLGVDFINTDHIDKVAEFMSGKSGR